MILGISSSGFWQTSCFEGPVFLMIPMKMALNFTDHGLAGNVSAMLFGTGGGATSWTTIFDFRRHPISIDREILRIMILQSVTEETSCKTGYTWYKCNGAKCIMLVHARPPLLEDRKCEPVCFTERHPPCSHYLPALGW